MKKVYILLALLPFFCSCEESESTASNDKSSNKHINEWIYKEMSTYYLWNTNLPQKSKLNFSSSPKDFFYSLLYKYEQSDGDRFSWIEKDGIVQRYSANTYDIGFEYMFSPAPNSSTEYVGQVLYVKPNTDAKIKDIKRGDIFSKVNGTRLTIYNLEDIFKTNSANITFVNYPSLSEKETKTILCSVNYAENPVYLDTVYYEGANRIGYLVYNAFNADEEDDSRRYDLDLNNVFGKFKAEGITHLVLDLRYNGGGLMSSATMLGSMIVPKLSTDNIFTKIEYNSILNSNPGIERVSKFTNKIKVGSQEYPLNNAGDNLQALYVLTSRWTASASELVINNLKPYIPNKVYLIGDVTVGKNVGSVTFEEKDNPENKWAIQPIILRYFDCNGKADFLDGIAPNVKEEDNSGSKKELGDKAEVMLSIALRMIENNGAYRSSATKSGTTPLVPVSSSIEKKPWANKTIVDINQLKSNN